MTPHTVSDVEVLHCRGFLWSAFGIHCLNSVSGYRRWFTYALERPVSTEETFDVLARINGFGPHRFEDTWESVERDTTSFWRSQL